MRAKTLLDRLRLNSTSNTQKIIKTSAAILYFIIPAFSYGQGVGQLGLLDPTLLQQWASSVIPQNIANSLIMTASFYGIHRPYQGATSIYSYNSIDVYLEATMMKVGSALPNALSTYGLNTSQASSIPAIPNAKIHVRKAFGEWVDVGVSAIGYRGQTIIGGDVKIVLSDPEEGPSYAFRFGYTHLNLPVLYTTSSSFAPELVTSRKLYFAEPYLGGGVRFCTGSVSVPLQLPLSTSPIYLTKSGSGWDEYLFTGIKFRLMGSQGLLLGLEGSFSFTGFHTLGLTAGIGL